MSTLIQANNISEIAHAVQDFLTIVYYHSADELSNSEYRKELLEMIRCNALSDVVFLEEMHRRGTRKLNVKSNASQQYILCIPPNHVFISVDISRMVIESGTRFYEY